MEALNAAALPAGAVVLVDSAARLRGQHGLKLPDAIQLASALAINADALVTHGRDFTRVRGLAVLG
jgi:predicted nucleic acid-binding protein